jgi:hypothetical protein
MTQATAPEQRLGRCLNQGRCTLADTNARIPIAADAELSCPECHMPIVVRAPAGKPQVKTKDDERPPPPKRLLIFGGVLAVMIGAGFAFGLFDAPKEEEEVAEASDGLVPEAEEIYDGQPPPERRSNVLLFTLGATPDTQQRLAPALAAAFMESKGCNGVAERPINPNRLRLSCQRKGLRYIIEIVGTPAATAFDQRPGRQVNLLLTTDTATGPQPRDPTTIGFAPAAIIVNPANPLKRLTLAQAAEVFSGAAESYSSVGGPRVGIRRVAPQDSNVEVQTFKALAPGGTLAPSTRRLGDSPAVAAVVTGDPDAIGLINPVDTGDTRVVAIAGKGAAVLPSPAAIADGSYPLSRRLKLEIPRGSRIRFARPFADFATTADGQAIVRGAGYQPLPANAARRALAPAPDDRQPAPALQRGGQVEDF